MSIREYVSVTLRIDGPEQGSMPCPGLGPIYALVRR